MTLVCQKTHFTEDKLFFVRFQGTVETLLHSTERFRTIYSRKTFGFLKPKISRIHELPCILPAIDEKRKRSSDCFENL